MPLRMWGLGILFFVGMLIALWLVVVGFMMLLFRIFARTSGWNTLVDRYGASVAPEGRTLTFQTIKVGAVRWRFCTTLVFTPQGLYIATGSRLPLVDAVRRHPPVLIPWSEFHSPRQGRLYPGWQAIQLSVGTPEIAALTFPQDLYEQMAPYLTSTPTGPSQ